MFETVTFDSWNRLGGEKVKAVASEPGELPAADPEGDSTRQSCAELLDSVQVVTWVMDPVLPVPTPRSSGNSTAVMVAHGNIPAAMAGKAAIRRLAADDITFGWISYGPVAALPQAHPVPLRAGLNSTVRRLVPGGAPGGATAIRDRAADLFVRAYRT